MQRFTSMVQALPEMLLRLAVLPSLHAAACHWPHVRQRESL